MFLAHKLKMVMFMSLIFSFTFKSKILRQTCLILIQLSSHSQLVFHLFPDTEHEDAEEYAGIKTDIKQHD
jgi:hypothetical protein